MPLEQRAEPFDDPEWIFEPKLDGYRALAVLEAGRVRLVSRRGREFKSYPTLASALANEISAKSAVIDGELAALDERGRSVFNAMRSRRPQRTRSLLAYVETQLRTSASEWSPMKRLRITVLDLVTKGPTTGLFARVMNANLASIMPQVVAVWCEQLGHDVRLVCYTGFEDLTAELRDDPDLLIVGAFTRSALTAYAISAVYRARGAVTVLGGPHARSYPQDSAKYFDYVLGFTDKALLERILGDPEPQRPRGLELSAVRQPRHLPGVKERWKFIAPTLAKAPAFKFVPMIGSMGCPYTCSFCIDSVVEYQPLDFDQISEDLRFLGAHMRRPKVAWHDPNFGVRFDEHLHAIERAVTPGRVRFVAESSLSLLSERNLRRLEHAGFVGMLPGVESWYDFGNKSNTRAVAGLDKVRQVADQVNLILRHIPFVQANFVLGLDCDEGAEPFELTKTFVDLAPGAYPAFSLFTAYGQAAPLNLKLQHAGRVLPFPFHFLDSNKAMNVTPANYGWGEFYALTADLVRHAWSGERVWRRLAANRGVMTKSLNFVRAMSSSRIRYQSEVAHLLETDASVRRYMRGETTNLPEFYRRQVRQDLGPLWDALPAGALNHDQNAYLESQPRLATPATAE
jgi:hypothetical protein